MARTPAFSQTVPPPTWWLRRVFRLGGLVTFAFLVYAYIFGPAGLYPSGRIAVEDVRGRTRNSQHIVVDTTRRAAVLEAFKDSYKAYERDSFGKDNHHPISRKGDNMSKKGPVGYFLIDSLDSLLVMGLADEFERARDWVEELSFDLNDKFHTFEITIRVLGGLLSAYHLSGNDPMFLAKAVDLADRLLPAFDTPSGIPHSFINLATRVGIPDNDNYGRSSVAEAGTLQLEFKYLSHLTGNPVYWKKVERVIDIIREQELPHGLVPIFLSPDTGLFAPSDIRLGSRGDSYYEYLLKQYLQTNRTEPVYLAMHDQAMAGVKSQLLRTSIGPKKLMYTVELLPRRTKSGHSLLVVPKQDHLVCFIGGSFLLGTTLGRAPLPLDTSRFTDVQTDDFFVGEELIKTCMDTYTSSATGLGAEIVMFYQEGEEHKRIKEESAAGRDGLKGRPAPREWWINSRHGMKVGQGNPPIDARNILRPETAESLFIAYRITGDPIYREWGWEMFQSFHQHCKIPTGGYASIRDVDQVPVVFEDNMETFWIAETLKYLYLLFSEETLLPLSDYVFNTECHPLPVFTPTSGMRKL